MTHAERLWSLPASCASIVKGPSLSVLPGRACVLTFSFAKDHEIEEGSLLFDKVESYKCTFSAGSNPDTGNVASRDLVEIPDSAWKADILAAGERSQARRPADLRHLMICFDAGPCFEFVCRDFEFRVK